MWEECLLTPPFYATAMRTVLVLLFFLGATLSSLILGYPPMYYVFLIHEILLIVVLLWFAATVFLRRSSDLLEYTTLFFLFFVLVLSPVNKVLAPDYASHFSKDPLTHVNYLAEEIGERPYLSENEKKTAAYIENVLTEKGFSPAVNSNVIVTVEGKREEAVLVCAHYDTVCGSPGADDNGSGVSVLLEVDIPENPTYTIVLAFFTGEEVGLVESRYFADEFKRELVGVICVDTVGVGEDFHISSLKEKRATSFFLSQLVYGLSDKSTPSIGPLYSDHVPFNEKGIRAIGLTRSDNRKYPHIHSEKDGSVDEEKLIETGETVQEVLLHFSYSENPYRFVYEALALSVVISSVLACAVHSLMDRVKFLKSEKEEKGKIKDSIL